MADQADDDEFRRSYFDRVYDLTYKAQTSNNENYERTILTTASAALGVSVHFFLQVKPARMLGLAITGWIFLGFSVAAILIAYRWSNWAQQETLAKAKKYYHDKDDKALDERNHWDERHGWCTTCAGISFLIGMLALALFFFVNLKWPLKKPEVIDQRILVMNADSGADGPAPGGQEKATGGAPTPPIIKAPPVEKRGAPTPQVVPVPNPSNSAPAPNKDTTPAAVPNQPPPPPRESRAAGVTPIAARRFTRRPISLQ